MQSENFQKSEEKFSEEIEQSSRKFIILLIYVNRNVKYRILRELYFSNIECNLLRTANSIRFAIF